MSVPQDTRIVPDRHPARMANDLPTVGERLRRIDAIEREIEHAWRRPYSVLWGSSKLKEVVVSAALDGAITAREADDIIDQYGLREV